MKKTETLLNKKTDLKTAKKTAKELYHEYSIIREELNHSQDAINRNPEAIFKLKWVVNLQNVLIKFINCKRRTMKMRAELQVAMDLLEYNGVKVI